MSNIPIFKATTTLDKYLHKNIYNFIEKKEDCECLLIGGKKIDLSEYPNLKGIFKTGVGTDNLPFKEAENRGIEICLPSLKTCEYIYEETASFTCHLIFNFLYKNIGDWESWFKKPRQALCEKKALIIGKGRIGKKVFDKLNLFMKVDSYDILTDKPDSLKGKVKNADIISLHLPLNKETEGMIDSEFLSFMKDGALIVNTARASIINEMDLLKELKNKRIKCALDVFWEEPYKLNLNDFDKKNLSVTPHLASTCDEFLDSAEKDFNNFLKSFKTH